MESWALTSIAALSPVQRVALKRGNITTVADLLLTPSADVSKYTKLAPSEVRRLLDDVCRELAQQPRVLEDIFGEGEEKFTTGDPQLDEAFGGGIRPGMLWEVVGESAAGKTQLGLQLSLMVQLPRKLGGLSGAACVLTTTSTLQTSRLVEISNAHPLLSPSLCGLADIHTMKTPDVDMLIQVLSSILPALLEKIAAQPESKPVKLLVIDTLTELFHSENTVSSNTLIRRSKALTEISSLLHRIATAHRVAVVVLNEVIGVFDRTDDVGPGAPGEVTYRDQARLFNRASSIPGEDRREASLGLVWANQVNTRVMLSRTERTRALDDGDARASKRARLAHRARTSDAPLTRIRRLSVLFSPLVAPSSLDYIVSDEGIAAVPEDPECAFAPPPPAPMPPLASIATQQNLLGMSPFDFAPEGDADLLDSGAPSSSNAAGAAPEAAEAEDGPPEVEEDEWDQYWKEADSDESLFKDVDLAPSLSIPPSSSRALE